MGNIKSFKITLWAILVDVLKVFVIKQFYKIFKTILMKNIKNCQKINCRFFSYKKFLKIFHKSMPLGDSLIFPYILAFGLGYMFRRAKIRYSI